MTALASPRRRYPSAPLIGVGAVVVSRGRVLLVRRSTPPRQGQWSLPGGLQKLGETVEEAVRREVEEETGITVRVLGLVDVVDLIDRESASSPVRYHYTLVDLLAVPTGGAMEVRAAGDAGAVAWIDVEALPGLGLWSETERVIRAAFRRWLDAGSP